MSRPTFTTATGEPVELNGRYHGQSAFLLAGGPSARELPVELLRERWCMTLNNAHVAWRGQASCTVDDPARFSLSLWRDPRVMKFTPRRWDRPLWDNRLMPDGQHWRPAGLKLRECPNVIGYSRHTAHHRLDGWGIEGGEVVETASGRLSVLLAALHILRRLGFTRVYLLGVDFDMSAERRYHFAEERPPTAVRNNQRAYAEMQTLLTELQPHFVRAGFLVKNCNPASKLTAFPFVPFEQAVAEAERCEPLGAEPAEIGDYRRERTQGMYRAWEEKAGEMVLDTKFRVVPIYFNPRGEARWRELFETWLRHYRASGSHLPITVVTDAETGVRSDLDVLRIDDEPEFCRRALDKSDWLKARAASALAPCIVMDIDAIVGGSIDPLIAFTAPLGMGRDAAGIRTEGWPEASPQMQAGVLVVNDASVGARWVRLFREKAGAFGHVRLFGQMTWTAVWREIGGETFAREFNWSHWWKAGAERAVVFHAHGSGKWGESLANWLRNREAAAVRRGQIEETLRGLRPGVTVVGQTADGYFRAERFADGTLSLEPATVPVPLAAVPAAIRGAAERLKPGEKKRFATADTGWTIERSAAGVLSVSSSKVAAMPALAKLPPRSGTGTELKRLLARIGIVPVTGCRCESRAAEMDRRGPEWCEENETEIVGWLREEADRRKLPFAEFLARLLIRRAVKEARRAG